MNPLIQKYVYHVVRYLPERDQEDVQKELTANIYDMLSDNSTDEEIKKVLYSLGKPRTLAENYRQDKRYLISPAYYGEYVHLLKWLLPLVAIIMFTLLIFITSIEMIASGTTNIYTIIWRSLFAGLGTSFSATYQTLVIATIVFVLIERHNIALADTAWDLDELSGPPVDQPLSQKATFPLSTTISSIVLAILTALFIILWALTGTSIPISIKGTGDSLALFDTTFLLPLIMITLIILVVHLVEKVLKIVQPSWTISTCVATIINCIVQAAGWIFLLTRETIFNSAFFSRLQTIDWGEFDFMQFISSDNLTKWNTAIIVLIVLITFCEIFYALYKTLKK